MRNFLSGFTILALVTFGIAHGDFNPSKPQASGIEGTYKVNNYNDLDDPAGYLFVFTPDSLAIYVDLDSTPTFVQPYIYDQFEDFGYLYTMSETYIVTSEWGYMQLHQIAGEPPFDCYFMEDLNYGQ